MLKITGLSKSFGDIHAVRNVSLTVPEGRIVGFVGPNGSGKSTTMRSVFGLVNPDAGEITFRGQPASDHLDRFGYMPEQRGLYPKMKIAEQVSFFAQLKQVEAKTADSDARELLTALGLEDRLDDPLEKLSHGNQQRVQLAVSLANRPDLLVLDEPFNGLDPLAIDTLQEVLSARVATGVGVLFSSHQLDLVERLCDEVVMIAEGSVMASGTVNDVRTASGSRQVNLTVDRPVSPLADALIGAGATIIDADTTTASITVTSDEVLDDLLTRARSVGEVTRFDYDLPPLQDIFTSLLREQPELNSNQNTQTGVSA